MTSSVLTVNKELDSDLKQIDFTSENNNLLKNACFDNITHNQKSRSWKNRAHAQAVSVTKHLQQTY